MNAIQILRLVRDIIQFGMGVYVVWAGWHMANRRWDRSHSEWLTGQILIVLGFILILGVR